MDEPVCPHCGYVQQDWWDGLTGDECDGSTWTTTCSKCGKEFHVEMNVSNSFTTQKETPK
jgi:phage terminase large subunit GpA-like protein